MSAVAKSRFSTLDDNEVQAIRAYLNEYVRAGGNSPP
jgi:hypothetical protein